MRGGEKIRVEIETAEKKREVRRAIGINSEFRTRSITHPNQTDCCLVMQRSM